MSLQKRFAVTKTLSEERLLYLFLIKKDERYIGQTQKHIKGISP